MKKTRILSFLLAALMTASSLPIMAPITVAAAAAETEPVWMGEDVLAGITPTANIATVQKDTDKSRGGYLHVGPRNARDYGLSYSFNTTFEQGKTYYISFDARVPVITHNNCNTSYPSGREYIRIYGNVNAADRYQSIKPYWKIVSIDGQAIVAASNNQIWYQEDLRATPDNSGIMANYEWRTYEMKIANVESTVANGYISMIGGNNSSYGAPFDIDNFKLYTREGDSDTGAITYLTADCYDFSTAPKIAGKTKGAFGAVSWLTLQDNFNNVKVTHISSVVPFTNVPVTEANINAANSVTSNTFVKYAVNKVLTPGTYELSGEFRNGYWKLNDFNVTLTTTANLGGTNKTLTTTTVSTEWTAVKATINVTENTNLSDITFTTNAIKSLDFRNVKLICKSRVPEQFANFPGYSVNAGKASVTASTTDKLNGATLTAANGTVTEMAAPATANGYMSIAPRTWLYNGSTAGNGGWQFMKYTSSVRFEKDRAYYIGFDVRMPVASNTSMKLRVSTDGIVNKLTNSNYVQAEEAISSYLHTVPGNGQWRAYVGKIVTDRAWSNVAFNFIRGFNDEMHPLNVDNFAIWYYENGNRVYLLDPITFDSAADVAKFTQLSHNNKPITLKHEVENTYYRMVPSADGKAATAVYTLADSSVKAGLYTFSTELRVPYYYFSDASINADDAAGKVEYEKKNEHTYTAVIDFENRADITVTNSFDTIWSKLEIPFELTADDKVKSITITPDYTYSAADPLALDIRNTAFVFERPATVKPAKAVNTETATTGYTVTSSDELNGASVSFPGMTATEVAPKAENGFLRLADRKTAVNGPEYFNIVLDETPVDGRKYYIGFNTRLTVDATADDYFRMRVMLPQFQNAIYNSQYTKFTEYNELSFASIGKENGTGPDIWVAKIGKTSEWKYFETEFIPKNSSGKNFVLSIRRGASGERHPFDIDDFKVWYYDANYNEVVVYSNDFNNENASPIGTSTDKDRFYVVNTGYELSHTFEAEYVNVMPAVGAAPAIKLEPADDKANEGIYKFTADVRVPFYLWTNYTQNERGLTVKFEMSDGKVSTVNFPVNVMWSKITAPVAVAEGAHIDTVTVAGAYTRTDSYALGLDIKNITFVKTNELEFEGTVADPDNLLNDASVKYTDGGIENKTVTDAGNGYMSVAPLGWNGAGVTNSFFNVEIPAVPVAGAKYYISFDYRANAKVINNATNNPRAIWVQVNGGEYAVPTAATFANMPQYISGPSANGVSPALNCGWTNFTATFNSPTALKFWVRRGFGDEIAGFDFDNFRVWYELGGITYEVCDFDFDNPYTSHETIFTKGQSKLVHNFDEDYSVMYTTDGNAPYFEYDVSELGLDEGVYTFSIDMMLPEYIYYGRGEANVKKADEYAKRKAIATFVYTDGITDTTSATTVTADVFTVWDEISMSMVVPRGCTLKSIRVATDVEELRGVQFKNPSLVKDYDYKQSFGDTDGLANLLTNSKIEAAEGSGIATVKGDSTNGYISIPARNYGEFNVTTLTLTDKVEAGTKYYISFDARKTVPAKHINNQGLFVGSEMVLRAQLKSVSIEEYNGALLATGGNTDYSSLRNISGVEYKFPVIPDEWAHVELVGTPVAAHAGLPLIFQLNRGTGNENHPIDIDNVKVWAVAADGTKTVLYDNDFNDAAVSPFAGAERFSTVAYITPIHAFEVDYNALAPIENGPASMTYDLTDLEVDGYGKVTLGEGVYTFELDARAHAFLFGNNVDNERTVTATFTFDNGDTSVATAEVNFAWATKTMYCIVPKDRTLVSLKLEMTEKIHNEYMTLDYMNVKLTSEAFPVVEAEEDEEEVNYLDGVTMYVDNTAPVEVVNDPNPYMNVAYRTGNSDNFLTIPVGNFKANTKYYISIDVKTTEAASSVIRPKMSFETLESLDLSSYWPGGSTNGMNGYWIVPDNDLSDIEGKIDNATEPGAGGVETYNPRRQLFMYTVNNEWNSIVGTFTPSKSVTNGKLILHRGPGDYREALDVDSIKIWTADGTVVYSNNFDESADMAGITATAAVSYVDLIPSYLELAPIDPAKKMTITYNLDLTEDESVEGKYNFKVSVKTAKETDTAPVAKVTFVYSDGTRDFQYLDITSEWNNIGKTDWLGRSPKLETIEIEIDSEVAIQLTHPVLNIQYKYRYGKPNTGIVMVLLKKLQGKMIAPKLYEYLPGGDFQQVEPTIHNEAAPKVQDETNEGFWAKQTAANPTTLSVVTEKGNTFVRVSDLDAGQRGIFYNTGVVLQPGKYTFSVDLRVSETEADKNYTAYTWHNNAKDWMYMRTMLQNPASVGSGNYANYDPVDTDTAMNNTGLVTGYQSKVTREWTTYTDTIVIKKPTVMIFKIGGGMSGNPDSHGFDIDNVSITGYVYADGSQAEDVTKVVNLIENGDLSKAPTVVAGDKYDAGKKNAWFQNNGMDYEYDVKGQPIKNKPLINHNHKITWNDDGYITVSGREFNMRNVWYNAGVTLKPGTYKISIDFKTANAGEKTYLRYSADGLFSAKVEDAFEVNSETWTTKSVSFQVTKDTTLKLNFYGGPSTAYIHDFCIDNVVLEKLS